MAYTVVGTASARVKCWRAALPVRAASPEPHLPIPYQSPMAAGRREEDASDQTVKKASERPSDQISV